MSEQTRNQPTVSIIMPTYNRGYIISRALEGVRRQTYQDFEVIIVDDGSSDHTEEVVRSFSDLPVSYVAYNPNQGANHARNVGMKKARGKYLAFLDTDNVYEPTSLQERVQRLDSGMDIVFSKIWIQFPDRDAIYPNVDMRSVKSWDDLVKIELRTNIVDTNTVMMRRECYEKSGGFDEKVKRFQDWEYFFRLICERRYNIGFIDQILVRGYVQKDSMTSRNELFFDGVFYIFKQHLNEARRYGYMKEGIERLILFNQNSRRYGIRELTEQFLPLLNDEEFLFFMGKAAQMAPVSGGAGNSRQMKIMAKDGRHWIDQKEIDGYIKGLDAYKRPKIEGRSERVIVSLTSYPARIPLLKYTLYSLLMQDFPADEIVVWLTEEEFPEKEKSLLDDFVKWKKYGIHIKWTQNLRSYTKLLPALREYKDCVIVTADDDLFYLPNWLRILYEEHKKDPQAIVAHRARRISVNEKGELLPYLKWNLLSSSSRSYWNFSTGNAGTLYPPAAFGKDIFRYDVFQKVTPTNDDVWFWAMAVMNGRKICVPKDHISLLIYTDIGTQLGTDNLWSKNIRTNDEQIRAVLKLYPEILERLREEVAQEAGKGEVVT